MTALRYKTNMCMKFAIFSFSVALFSSCGLFDNDNTTPPPIEHIPVDRDYILINATPSDNLTLYQIKI